MPGIHTVCITILLAVVLLFDRCFGYPSIRQRQSSSYCEGCDDSCDRCEFGVVKTAECGVEQCAKGPDEICGGPRNIYGICGEGMSCHCNHCIGCSSEGFECSQNVPCLPSKSLRAHIERFVRLPTAM